MTEDLAGNVAAGLPAGGRPDGLAHPEEDPAARARETLALPRPPAATPTPTVVIEEGVIPRRLRRPLDLARFLLAAALVAATVLVAYFATGTTEGIEEDITEGASRLPGLVRLALNVIAGIGLVGLPVAAAVSLVVRRRVRQLFDSLLGLLVTVIALTAVSYLVDEYASDRWQLALTGTTTGSVAATAPIIGGLIAFATVARLMGRRPWNALSVVVIGSLSVVALLSSTAAVPGLLVSIFIGWGLGLIARYALGTPTTRP